MNEVSITTEDAVKRRILLGDGRYMIFFSFETRPGGAAASDISPLKRDSGSAPTTGSGGPPVV
jgi:hypothetical protein